MLTFLWERSDLLPYLFYGEKFGHEDKGIVELIETKPAFDEQLEMFWRRKGLVTSSKIKW